MKYYARILVSSLVILQLFASASAVAKDKPEWRSWPNGDRLVGSLGYYWPKLETKAAVSDADGNLGALIGFEETLGLDDNKGTGIANIAWRISKRNSLLLNYFKLNRDSTQDSTVQVFIPNDSPPPDNLQIDITLPISAKFDIQSIDISYAFSVIFTEKHNLGLGIGLALQELDFGLQASDSCDVEPACSQFGPPQTFKSTAPLPTFNIIYDYALNDKWLLNTSFGYLGVDFDLDNSETLDGQIWNVSVAMRWKTWDHFGFTFAYKLFDVDIDYRKRDLLAAADYDYRGFLLGIDAFF